MTRIKSLALTLVVLFSTVSGAAAFAAPAAADHGEDTDHYVEITFEGTDWDEIVVSDVDTNHGDYENVTEEGEELPAIDLSELENDTEVTFNWEAVDAEAFHIDNEDGEPIEHDEETLTDDTGTLTVTWDDDLEADADAYRFESATAYNDTDVIGTLGDDSFTAGAVDAADDVDGMSFGAGVSIAIVLGGIAAVIAGRD